MDFPTWPWVSVTPGIKWSSWASYTSKVHSSCVIACYCMIRSCRTRYSVGSIKGSGRQFVFSPRFARKGQSLSPGDGHAGGATQEPSCHVTSHCGHVPGLISGARILNSDLLVVSGRARSHSPLLSASVFSLETQGWLNWPPWAKGREKWDDGCKSWWSRVPKCWAGKCCCFLSILSQQAHAVSWRGGVGPLSF